MIPVARPIAVLVALAAPLSAQDLVRTHFGASTTSNFGANVDVRDDFDSDGVPDVVVSEPRFLSGGGWAGRVLVISGATGAIVRHLVGNPGTGVGIEVASAGDLDGDGAPDVVASNPDYDNRGIVTAWSGASGAALWSVLGAGSFPRFGWRLAALDDVNGDGRRDVLVLSPQDGTAVARILSGPDGAVLRSHATGSVYEGIALEDVDADGVGDYALSYNTGGARVEIRSGATGVILRTIPTTGVSFFGIELLRVDDIDGDGLGDVAVGIPSGEGIAQLFSTATGALVRTLAAQGSCGGDGFGNRLSPAGDVDLDGLGDVWMGTTNGQYAKLLSLGSGAEILTYRGGKLYQHCPEALQFAALPDLTGDGRPEIVVASNCPFQSSPALGNLSVYAGATSNLVGTASCFGDGSGAACPCGNSGAPGAGCANSTGFGARLAAHGSASASNDDLWLEASDMPSSGIAIVFAGTSAVNGGFGVPAFDGLRCAGGSVRRLQAMLGCAIGEGWFGPGLRQPGQWSAGETRHFQAYYRNNAGPCGTLANFTNLVTVTFGA